MTADHDTRLQIVKLYTAENCPSQTWLVLILTQDMFKDFLFHTLNRSL